jgi:CheY-like chemotaxis protein
MQTARNYAEQQPLVLVIEEELQVVECLTTTLTGAGYLIRSCSAAQEAIAAASEVRPDLIICDVVVQEQGGAEICQQIKREATPGEMPVMFLSPNQIPDIIRRRGPLGGSYYLRKPFDPNVLLDLLERTLSSTRQLAMAD